MAPMSPVPAARSVSSRMRSFSPAVNVRRLGRFDNSGLAAAGAGTNVGLPPSSLPAPTGALRPSSVPAPAAACASTTLLGMTTRQFSYALKSKLLGGLCLIIIGTEGKGEQQGMQSPAWNPPAVGADISVSEVPADAVPGVGSGHGTLERSRNKRLRIVTGERRRRSGPKGRPEGEGPVLCGSVERHGRGEYMAEVRTS